MKKTLILAMLALAACAQAATTAVYWGGTSHVDLLFTEPGNTHSGSSLKYLSSGLTMRMDAKEQLPLIETEGNTDYTLAFNQTGDVDFYLNEALYFYSVTASSSGPANYTIDLGTKGSITTNQEFNIGNGHQKDGSFTLSADFSAEKMAELIASVHNGTVAEYSRDLLVANANNGFWNVKEQYDNKHMTFTSDTLAASGLVYAGIVSSADKILSGQYGLVYTELGTGVEKMMLVARTPEPATATLSLLALAALASRRRRH